MSKSKTTTITDDVAQMKKDIAELTGRLPVSNERRYLQIRLADLRRRPKDELPHRKRDHAVPMTVSLGTKRVALAEKMRQRGGFQSMSQLVRKALDEYAVRNGFAVEVERMTQKEARNG